MREWCNAFVIQCDLDKNFDVYLVYLFKNTGTKSEMTEAACRRRIGNQA
jgi:hypothetical protein